jgi:uncharacterized protein (TIGR00645 family)
MPIPRAPARVTHLHDRIMEQDRPKALKPLPNLIFLSRWLQLPLYLGLIVAQGVYVIHFTVELWHLVEKATSITETDIMLRVLGLIDVVMIANLLVMVIVGGYETFVSRMGLEGHPDQPEWLSHVNAAVLKVKLATAIITISSIHLLQTFMNASKLDERTMLWQTIIHLTLVLSAIAIAFIDRLMPSPAKAGISH